MYATTPAANRSILERNLTQLSVACSTSRGRLHTLWPFACGAHRASSGSGTCNHAISSRAHPLIAALLLLLLFYIRIK